MRLIALLLGTLLLQPAVAAEVYKTTDEAGNVIYSDKPSPEAETIMIPETQTIPADTAPPFEYTPPAPETRPYTGLSIVSPTNDEALRPEDQAVRVTARAEPAFRGQDTYVLFLDGREHSAGKSPVFVLPELERGTHSVAVALRDPAGTELIRSEPVTFHVLRTTVLQKKKPTPPPGGKPPPPKKP
jgi:hypothetical protein